MVSRSGYLNRLVFHRRNDGETDTITKIKIDNFPGDAETFELAVKFCCGWKIDLTAANVAPSYCATHFLEMSDDLEQGNLISETVAFLSFLLLSSWKDKFFICRSCESIGPWAKESQILKRCTEAISWKVSIDPKTFKYEDVSALCFHGLADNGANSDIPENWWLEDVSCLRIDHFVEVIGSIKRKGVSSQLIGSCIAHWTGKWLSCISSGLDNLPKRLTDQFLRVTAESLITTLPEDQSSVSCNFLLHLLKLEMMLRTTSGLLNKIKERIALMLDRSSVSDLVVKNYGNNDSLYDVNIVAKVVETYASSLSSNPAPRLLAVRRLVDGYLSLVARDEKLSLKYFQSLAEALPRHATYCDDNLYEGH